MFTGGSKKHCIVAVRRRNAATAHEWVLFHWARANCKLCLARTNHNEDKHDAAAPVHAYGCCQAREGGSHQKSRALARHHGPRKQQEQGECTL